MTLKKTFAIILVLTLTVSLFFTLQLSDAAVIGTQDFDSITAPIDAFSWVAGSNVEIVSGALKTSGIMNYGVLNALPASDSYSITFKWKTDTSLPSGSWMNILRGRVQASSEKIFDLYVQNSGSSVVMYLDTPLGGSYYQDIQANTWYTVKIDYICDSNGLFRLSINGQPQRTLTGNTAAYGQLYRIDIGNVDSASETYDNWYDDLIFEDTVTASPTTSPTGGPQPTTSPTDNLAQIPDAWGPGYFPLVPQYAFVDYSVTHNGNPSIRIEKGGGVDDIGVVDRAIWLNQYYPCKPGDKIVFGAWMKTEASSTDNREWGIRVAVDFYGDGHVVDGYPGKHVAISQQYVPWGTTDWTLKAWELTVPSTTYNQDQTGASIPSTQIDGVILWVQVRPAEDDGRAWMADSYLYINPQDDVTPTTGPTSNPTTGPTVKPTIPPSSTQPTTNPSQRDIIDTINDNRVLIAIVLAVFAIVLYTQRNRLSNKKQ